MIRDDVIAVLDTLGLRDIILVGHSMGGAVAYLIAQAQPDRIARVVVEDVPPPFPRTRVLPERPRGRTAIRLAGRASDRRTGQRPHPPLVDPPFRHHCTHTAHRGGPTSHLPQDLLVEVAQLVPDCTLLTIAVGHNIHKTEPEKLSGAILTWLTSTGAAAQLSWSFQ